MFEPCRAALAHAACTLASLAIMLHVLHLLGLSLTTALALRTVSMNARFARDHAVCASLKKQQPLVATLPKTAAYSGGKPPHPQKMFSVHFVSIACSALLPRYRALRCYPLRGMPRTPLPLTWVSKSWLPICEAIKFGCMLIVT